MTQATGKRVTQKDFCKHIETHNPRVHYHYPGTFTAGSVQVDVRLEWVGGFLAKLEKHMSFKDYDTLSRAVWVSHLSKDDNHPSQGGGRYHLDENMHNAIAQGLRQRGIEVTTTKEAGLISSSDEEQLDAHREGRVIVTHDDELIRLHYQNLPHSGIAFARARQHSISDIVNALTSVHRRYSAEAMIGHIEYL